MYGGEGVVVRHAGGVHTRVQRASNRSRRSSKTRTFPSSEPEVMLVSVVTTSPVTLWLCPLERHEPAGGRCRMSHLRG